MTRDEAVKYYKEHYPDDMLLGYLTQARYIETEH